MPHAEDQCHSSAPPTTEHALGYGKRRWRQLERVVDKDNYNTQMMLAEAKKMRLEVEEMNRKALELVTALAGIALNAPSTVVAQQPIANETVPTMSSTSYELEDIQRVLDTLCSRAENVSMHIDAENTVTPDSSPQTPIKSTVPSRDVRVPGSILKTRAVQATPYNRHGAVAPTPSASAKKVRFLLKKPKQTPGPSVSVDSENAFFNS